MGICILSNTLDASWVGERERGNGERGNGNGDREKRKGERGNGDSLLVSVFPLFTHQTGHLVSSFNMENDQHIKAHLLRWFPAIL